MTIPQTMNNRHWNYLLALDEDAAELSRYIEFTPDNYEAYSLELARLLMTAASETDVVAKIACGIVAPTTATSSIRDYQAILSQARPNLIQYPVEIRRFGLSFTPWVNWTVTTPPLWWTAYNKVKHQRDTHFADANLKNALNAIAGLYIMILYAFPEEAQNGALHPRSQLFSIPQSHVTGYGPIEDGTPLSYLL